MTRPRIAVLTASEDTTRARRASWESLAPVDFVSMESGPDLLRELARQRFDGLVIEHACLAASGAPLWSELVHSHPSLPIAVWGADASGPEGRPAPVYGLSEDAALAEFLSVDVVGVTRGRISGVSLPSVMQVLQMEQRSCRLRVRSGSMMGELYVRNGALVHAAHRGLAPRDAALAMLCWGRADVVFDRVPPRTTQTIEESMDFLVIEAARLLDEQTLNGDSSTVARDAMSSTSTASWLVPALLRGDADALCAEVLSLPSALLCVVVDFEHRVRVAQRTREEGAAPRLASTLSDAMSLLSTLLEDLQLRGSAEDALVTVSGAYLLLRPLRTRPTLALFAVFDRATASLGLVRAQFSKLAQDFGAGNA